jgi:hypothetical protein
MKTRELLYISILILLIPFAIFSLSASKDIGDLGSLMGAFTGLIAVIWFYRGLRLQSIQIEEQRIQFTKQHHLHYQDSLLAFLQQASEKIENSYKELIEGLHLPDASQIFLTYLNSVDYYKEALESSDPKVVRSNVQEWMKIEGPCVRFMSSVKDIITLHKKRLGLECEAEERDVAEYVFINSSNLFQQPFMCTYQSTVAMLSEQMTLLAPGRKAMVLASTISIALLAPKEIVIIDKIIEDIEKYKSNNIPIPKICEQINTYLPRK